jgi:hypothetical protein
MCACVCVLFLGEHLVNGMHGGQLKYFLLVAVVLSNVFQTRMYCFSRMHVGFHFVIFFS